MNCQRCDSMRGGQAVALIRSEILHLKVCGQCANEASELGLQIEALDDCATETTSRFMPRPEKKLIFLQPNRTFKHLST